MFKPEFPAKIFNFEGFTINPLNYVITFSFLNLEVLSVNTKQEILINRLHELLAEINEEAINDEEFSRWLNENYFFEKDLEEVLVAVKKARENY